MKAFEETSISPLSSLSRAHDRPDATRHKFKTVKMTSHNDDISVGESLPRMTSSRREFPAHSPNGDVYEPSIDANLSSAEQLNRSLRTNKRKNAARRNLLGSIYTKHNDVQRSYTFVAGERPQVEIRFPKVYFSDSQPKMERKQLSGGQISPSRSSRRSTDVSSTSAGALIRSSTSPSTNKPVQRSKSHKLSLPEIIMEFNIEANTGQEARRNHVITPTEDDEDEREFAAPYEEFLNRPRNILNNPCRSKYRPVTPGLLESLNKLRMPSKVRTEQWIKSSQSTQKSYCGNNYRPGNLDNANLAFPNWIYTDT